MEDLLYTDIDEISREKTELLEELILLQSDDIEKLDVQEVLLQYFENEAQKNTDAWGNDNQAMRQLYSATHMMPRIRTFPGSGNISNQKSKLPQRNARSTGAATSEKRINRVVKARAMHDESSKQKELSQKVVDKVARSDSDTSPTNEDVVKQLEMNGSTYADIETELAALAAELSKKSLSKAVYTEQLHELASRMVNTVISQVTEQLGERTAALSRENTQQRVERVAHELVNQVTENATNELQLARELTYNTERAKSVAYHLLEDITNDVANQFD